MVDKTAIDYRIYYDLEGYLFDKVGPGFAETGTISPADFYMIIIWKANRAKSRIRKRLDQKAGGFSAAVSTIAQRLSATPGARERLETLMVGFGFFLPMATAILTVLYPKEFSVYDVRVCQQLRDFEKLAQLQFSDRLWEEYQRYLSAVDAEAPNEFSLRDKDRYLWGRSFFEGVENDLRK
jgi:hypothetical protein